MLLPPTHAEGAPRKAPGAVPDGEPTRREHAGGGECPERGTALDEHAFDALIVRLTNGTSRRGAVRGLAGGALTSVGAAALVKDGLGKGKGRKNRGKGSGRAKAEKKKKKKAICFCPSNHPLSCTTQRFKKKNANKKLRKFPASSPGECPPLVTTAAPTTLAPTTTSTSSTTVTPTTSSTTLPPSSTEPPTSQEP